MIKIRYPVVVIEDNIIVRYYNLIFSEQENILKFFNVFAVSDFDKIIEYRNIVNCNVLRFEKKLKKYVGEDKICQLFVHNLLAKKRDCFLCSVINEIFCTSLDETARINERQLFKILHKSDELKKYIKIFEKSYKFFSSGSWVPTVIKEHVVQNIKKTDIMKMVSSGVDDIDFFNNSLHDIDFDQELLSTIDIPSSTNEIDKKIKKFFEHFDEAQNINIEELWLMYTESIYYSARVDFAYFRKNDFLNTTIYN